MIKMGCDNKIKLLAGILWIIFFLAGCADSSPNGPDEYLIRVGDRILTVSDFNRAFELAKTPYSHNALQNPAVLKAVQTRLLNQLSEDMIIMERAEDIKINVSDAEVERAIADIKKDYPDDVFEQTLLEYAVSYSLWKDGLKIRLLKEKVIAAELDEQITVTAGDISEYVEKYPIQKTLRQDVNKGLKDINEVVIEQLRRKKAEDAYISWIKGLKKKYIVEINRAQWKNVTGS